MTTEENDTIMTTATAQKFNADERRAYLGASEIAAVMGLDRYKTALDVWNEKTGRTTPFTGNAHTERGNRLEAIAAEEYSNISGVKLRRHNQGFTHSEYDFIRGHIDRMAVGERRVIEVKCPSLGSFRQMQRKGLPEGYIVQSQVYMGLADCPKLTFVIFCADAWELASFDVEFDEDIYNAAIKAAKDFWTSFILPDVQPASDHKSEYIEIEAIGGDVIERTDDEFLSIAQTLKEAAQIKREGDDLFEMAKMQMIEAIDGLPGRYAGGVIKALSYVQSPGRKTIDRKRLEAVHPDLNLVDFEKVGKPFFTFKPTFIAE